MRIIAGRWRGRLLDAPAGSSTRPTADRVREALFSMLVSRLGSFEDLSVADLFAGTGALGFEALSRGAAHVTFVERDSIALAAIRANAAKLGASDRISVSPANALSLPRGGPFDLIFADPPYEPGSGSAAAAAVVASSWLAPSGWLCVESAARDPVTALGLAVAAERDVGRARLTLMQPSA